MIFSIKKLCLQIFLNGLCALPDDVGRVYPLSVSLHESRHPILSNLTHMMLFPFLYLVGSDQVPQLGSLLP